MRKLKESQNTQIPGGYIVEKVHVVFVTLTLPHSNIIHSSLNIENFACRTYSTKQKWEASLLSSNI